MADTATPAPAAPVVFVAGAFAGRTATAYGPGPVDGLGQHRTHIHLDGGVGRILVHTANLRIA